MHDSSPNKKYPLPSTKKGRFSAKYVSNAVRFTTAGSTSTWPKSGLTEPVSVRFEVSKYLKSTPTRAPTSFAR
jgi:hypothetical protein